MTRNDREWDPPPSPALSSQPRTRHAPWQFQFCLSQREADPISLLQLPAGHRHPSQGFVFSGFPLRGWTRLGGGRSGKHPAARGSAAAEWPVAAGRGAGKTSSAGRHDGPRLSAPTCRQSTKEWRCWRPPHLRYVGVGWIYCRGRLLTHWRAGGEIAVSCFLEGSCVQNASMAAGAITRSRGWLYRPYKYELFCQRDHAYQSISVPNYDLSEECAGKSLESRFCALEFPDICDCGILVVLPTDVNVFR